MSSKQDSLAAPAETAASAAPARLPFALAEVSGKDAEAFLQRQTMNDVRLLDASKCAQRSGLLNAEGRVLFLFVLFRLAPERFALLCPDQDAGEIVDELRRYVFRSKLSLSTEVALQAVGGEGRGPACRSFEWDAQRWVGWQESDSLEIESAMIDLAVWRHADIEQGIAHLPSESRGRFTPHMLGLHRWHAISVSKGCYPGQEIVARTHFLGRHKRDLFHVRCDSGVLLAGDTLLAEEREVGRVVCATGGDALGVLPTPANDPLRTSDGRAVSIIQTSEAQSSR